MNKKELREKLNKMKSPDRIFPVSELLALIEELIDSIDEELESPPKDKPFIAYVEDCENDDNGFTVLMFDNKYGSIDPFPYKSVVHNRWYGLQEIKEWYPMPEEILEKHKKGEE